MNTLNKVGKWYVIKETLRKIFGSSKEGSSFGETTFRSKEPMRNDAYKKD